MTCTCSDEYVKEVVVPNGYGPHVHSPDCRDKMRAGWNKELAEKIAWHRQKQPCSGPGYSHPAHGNCPGYTYDRT